MQHFPYIIATRVDLLVKRCISLECGRREKKIVKKKKFRGVFYSDFLDLSIPGLRLIFIIE